MQFKYMLWQSYINENSLSTMGIRSRKTAKQTCGSRLGQGCGRRPEAMQKISWTHMTVIHKNKRITAGNSEKVVHSWSRHCVCSTLSVHFCVETKFKPNIGSSTLNRSVTVVLASRNVKHYLKHQRPWGFISQELTHGKYLKSTFSWPLKLWCIEKETSVACGCSISELRRK